MNQLKYILCMLPVLLMLGSCWNTTGSPSLADHVVKAGKDFVATIPEMESGTYYIRAFAVNKAGVGYGKEMVVSVDKLYITLDE